MPKINFIKDSSLAPDQAFKKIQDMLSDDPDLRKLDSSYKCQFDSSQLSGSAKGSKFDANLKVSGKGGGSLVQLDVSIPLMLTPFKGLVEKTIQSKLNKILA